MLYVAQAAKMGCTVDTLTLSIQQKILAEERIAKEGLQDKIRVHLLDYRNLPADFEHQFDAFICVEMIEVSKFSLHLMEHMLTHHI